MNAKSRFDQGLTIRGCGVVASALDETNEQSFVDKMAEDVPMEIPDVGAAVTSDIEIAEAGSIEDIRVGVDMTHTCVGDLRIDLIAPDGSADAPNDSGKDGHRRLDAPVKLDELEVYHIELGPSSRGLSNAARIR